MLPKSNKCHRCNNKCPSTWEKSEHEGGVDYFLMRDWRDPQSFIEMKQFQSEA